MRASIRTHLALSGTERLAVTIDPGTAPWIMFCCGYGSDMSGLKATAIAEWCRQRGRGCVRFDYRGHGASSGRLQDSTIGAWRADARLVLERVVPGPVVLVGSSMGAWIATLLARDLPARTRGLVTVAAAPDFTTRLLPQRLSPADRLVLARDGVVWPVSRYGSPLPVGRDLMIDGGRHCVLDQPITVSAPLRCVHGMADPDVPWTESAALMAAWTDPDAKLTLIKDGDHRLSRPEDIALMLAVLGDLVAARPREVA